MLHVGENRSESKVIGKPRVTLETAIEITKHGISPISCWPPITGSSNIAFLRHNICLMLSIFHLVFNIGASLNCILKNIDDPSRVIKISSETCSLMATLVKTIIWKLEAPRFQVLIDEMESFLKYANYEDRKLIQSYVDRALLPHIVIFLSIILGPLAFIMAPILSSQSFPADLAYPFSTEATWLWALLYFSQSICIVQVGCMVCADVFSALLLWYAGARFEILTLKLEAAVCGNDLADCVQQHQKLIRYVDRLRVGIRFIAIVVVTTTLIAVTAGGVILMRRPSILDVTKYIFYELACMAELFLFTWPADNLIDISERVGNAAFGCNWIGKPREMVQNLIMIIRRSQTPVVITVDGLLPVLSLAFYGSTLATTFSYVTTLRAMIGD